MKHTREQNSSTEEVIINKYQVHRNAISNRHFINDNFPQHFAQPVTRLRDETLSSRSEDSDASLPDLNSAYAIEVSKSEATRTVSDKPKQCHSEEPEWLVSLREYHAQVNEAIRRSLEDQIVLKVSL